MIRFDAITKYYKGHKTPALNNISCQLDLGDFCVLTGPLGSGKTTFLKLLFCMEKPDMGQLYFGDKDLTKLKKHQIPPLKRQMGFIFEKPILIHSMSLLENLLVPLRLNHTPLTYAKKIAQEALETVGLGPKTHLKPSSLSLGEIQILCVLRAMIAKPMVLLCDEPTKGLDPEKQALVLRLLAQFHHPETLTLVATHHPELYEDLATRTLYLSSDLGSSF